MTTTHIAVIGGGIGGLTAAIALRRKGLDARVYERAPALREVGAGIWMPPNAMQVFDRLGDAAHATTPNLGQGGAQAVADAYRPRPTDRCVTRSWGASHLSIA